MDDCELLREYRDHRSEQAFAALVERHLGLVYAVARRVVREPTAAEDVVQAVFIQLARKAGTVRQGQALSGWLYRATQRAAFDALRGDHRRRQRETIAMNLAEKSTRPEIVPEQLTPFLEEAMGQLRRVEQDAVVLRYFEGKTLRETGAILALSEDAARKRVDRALDKMRAYFARSGITASAALLASALTAHAAEPPPAGLAAGLVHASLAQAAQTSVAGAFLKGLTMTTKTKLTLATVAVLIIAAIPITVESRQLTRINGENSELVRQDSSLQSKMTALRKQLREINGGSLSLQGASNGAGYLPVSLEIVKGLEVPVMDNRHKLSSTVVDLLGLTTEEAAGVQNVLTELENRVHAYERANIQEITLDQLPVTGETDFGQAMLDYLKAHPELQSLYEIPPISDEGQTALQQWIFDGLANEIGPERAEIFQGNMNRQSLSTRDFTPTEPGGLVIFALTNRLDGAGKRPGKNDAYMTANNSGPRSMGGLPSSSASPSEWDFLFKGDKDSTLPPQYTAVQNNLRQIFTAAQQYMLDKNAPQAAYTDFVGTGTDKQLHTVTPVAGESYDTIVVHQTDASLSVAVPGLGAVEYSR